MLVVSLFWDSRNSLTGCWRGFWNKYGLEFG